jgi:transcriptional regulator of acetoin/glycerol metabolism
MDAAVTRRARDELLTHGLLALPVSRPGVRDVIERSWRRCVAEAVPTSPDSIPYRDAADLQPVLQEAAAPVLDRLGEHLTDVRVAMFVSDESGRIVLRRAHEPRQRTLLDRASAAEGFDFSETSVGTNGLGTVVEERRPLVVCGTEHYNDLLEPFTCAGTPIFEPFTRRLLGTFSLASDAADASPLMYGIATDVGRQIEANLTAMLGAREQALIRAYLLADQAEREPVIVVNERTVFANTAGLAFLTSESHALLWAHLREAPRTPGPARTLVPLPAGWQDAVVEPVDGRHGEHPAYCIRLLPALPDVAAGRRKRPTADRTELHVHPLPEVDRQLAAAARHRESLALDGGPGTGKLHTARAVLAAAFAEPAPLVLDVATFRPGRQAEWFDPATGALDAGHGVVLRHLQDLPLPDVNRVKALAERAQAAARGVPLVVTVDLTAAPGHVSALVGQLATTVQLPALRDMHRHIPELVTGVLATLTGPAAGTRFSSDALQTLMSSPWPGNVGELRRTVEALASRLPGRTVRSADLPAALQTAPHRRLTLMETAERQAIVTALHRCGGNRSRAAEELGIGRTTLYRKMQHHHLTP